MLLLNLILTELLICLYGIPVDLVASLQGGWVMGRELCVATGFALTVLGRQRNITTTTTTYCSYIIMESKNYT